MSRTEDFAAGSDTPPGHRWSSEWPDHMSLGDAAHEMQFDLFGDDDDDHPLTKGHVAISDIKGLTPLHMDFSDDAEDRMTPIRNGLTRAPHGVPPVVLEHDGSLRDGHHRIKAAKEFGMTHVPAYRPMPKP